IQQLREALPRWMPLVGIAGGHVNLVPVDFVAAALDRLAHVEGLHGRCFHLTDPHDYRVGEVLNLLAEAAHAPRMRLLLDPRMIDALALGARVPREAPSALLRLIDHPTTFDCRHARQLLAPAAIQVPPLARYAWRLWDFWERQLDPDLSREQRLRRAVHGKTVLVTGGSSGIGLASARKLGAAGARIILVARDGERLEQVRAELAAAGAEVSVFACDLTEPSATEELIRWLAAGEHPLDILINNAGHSIRRGIDASFGRLHDFERLMQVNYLAAVRLTLGVLPSMTARASGHVISISSIGVLTHASRFAAYNASKAALEAFTRCASGEFSARGVRFTVVNLPLVRTPMVAPTKMYDAFVLLSPEQAADLVCDAVVRKPERLSTGLGRFAQIVDFLAPQVTRAVMGESFRMFPDSQAAGGPADSMTPEARAFAALLRQLHF
ncbi:MAG: SDR family NAD(P)-dependent oxidoreductase, partial [Pseudomonadota bacterium]|nr:SDR family NAD(P)-dependent oxidoreductase [Pseudomonadota bacterium]